MKSTQKMPLKSFIEETTKILHNSSSDELREILARMADEIKPHARADFIKKLSPTQAFQRQNMPMNLEILGEIDSLKQDILELGEEEPDWESDDEDSLGQYEQFLPSLSNLFDKAAELFEQGHYEIVQKAYQELFSIFDIEDDYGRGIHIYDVEDTDLEEARARYFRSLYMTAKEERASTLLKAMTEMADEDFHTRPNLQEIIDISSAPLPNFTQFLQEWIELTRKGEKPSYDAWLREGTFLLGAPVGLENLAKQEGYKRPRVYLDWMNSLIEAKKFTDAVAAGKTALSCLPENQPIRAAIGDLMTLCGEHLKDEQIQQEGRWTSFKNKPDLPKLIVLYEQSQSTNRPSLMQQAIEAIETHRKKTNKKTYERSWERDDIESASHPSSTLLLHALLFSGNKDQAFALAKRGESLGWSFGDNPQPLFIAYCLISATKCSLVHLPPHLKQFWECALKTSRDSVWMIEEDKNDISHKLENIYGKLFENPRPIDPEMLEWCLEAAQKQVEDIVSNQHRKAYDRAALVTAACTDTLKITNPSKATEFFWKIQNKFPRHSAFQAKLGRVNVVKPSRS